MKHTIHYSLFALVLLIVNSTLFSQTKYYDFGFQRNLSIQVKDSNDNILKYPWAGGMNNCQFSAIDLNGDGIKDLVVFDKSGNRLLTFINKGTNSKTDYVFAPEYEEKFPPMYSWVILADYNNDGKEDIFTYSGMAAIRVYKNISDSVNGLKFKLITNELSCVQNGTYTNIYTSDVEFPAFADINNDGALDILAFYPLGTFVNYFENQSYKKYGTYDSLYFVAKSKCWGKFAVSSWNNAVMLNQYCPLKCDLYSQDNKPDKKIEHIGNSLLAIDSKVSGNKDLIVGDFEYPNLNYLTNGGTSDTAHIVSQDSTFPSNSKPVKLYASPIASSIDVNNDGLADLIVSPFDSEDLGDNFNCVWYYKNTGTKTHPVFTFQTDNFLQGDMIDVGAGAYPVVFSYFNDSLSDLIVSNYGYRSSSYYKSGKLISNFSSKLALYKNTGTKLNPEYSLITRDLANTSSLNLTGEYPAFADLNGDGVPDMLLGNGDGSLLYFVNTASKGQPANFVYNSKNYQGLSVKQYGGISTPQLIDINGDSLPDLVVGNQAGTIYYYQNTGTKSVPVFTLVTKNFGGVNVTDTNLQYTGYSVPCFFRDKTGKLKLFVGSQTGYIYYYTDIDNNLNGKFTLSGILTYEEANNNIHFIQEGERTGVAVIGLNSEGFPDLIVGNYAGGLAYYQGINPPLVNGVQVDRSYGKCNFTLFPNPAKDVITIEVQSAPNSRIQIEILNIFGQVVYSSRYIGINRQKINISNFPAGIYICKLNSLTVNNYFASSKKFIINR